MMASYSLICVVTLLTLITPESRSQLDVCGQAVLNARVVGGQSALPGDWPWQAAIITYGYLGCGGSLINNQWVLTAASCFPSNDTSNLLVYLGSQSVTMVNSNQTSQTVIQTVAQIINHPNYNYNTLENNISLLKLSSPVNFTEYILPVCLAAPDSTFNNGTAAWITTLGRTESGGPLFNLTETEVPVVGNRQCKCDYGLRNITNNMMCAALHGKGSCSGNNGGPLVIKQNGRWIQGGVMTFSIDCTTPNLPTIYTRVSQYQSWINSQITTNPPGFVTFTSSGTDGDLSVTCPTPAPVVALPPLPTAELCGKTEINTKIVGGQYSLLGNWPWQVGLVINGGGLCGGSLINREWVLTAASCFQSNSIGHTYVILSVQSSYVSIPFQYLMGTKLIKHPKYVARTGENNISLVKLSSPVNFTNYLLPICLAASDSTFYNGTNTWVTGLGDPGSKGEPFLNPYILREVQLPVLGNRQCNCDYGGGSITDNMMCAGSPAGVKGPCQGDDGGPLMSKQNGRWIQGGVIGFGNDCGQSNLPSVYTRVSQYQSWINSQITSDPPGFVTFTSSGTDGDLSVSCPTLPPTTTAKPVVCGRAPLNSHNQGGSSVVSAGVWPWMVSLQNNGNHVCGGTLVAVDSVLSDAKCFSSSLRASDWTVVLGRLNQNGSNRFEVTLTVTSITLSNLTGSNVAVLRLSTPPPLSDYIQPICLDNGRTFSVGSTCWAAGWSSVQGGEEQVLQEFQTSVVDCGTSTPGSICTGAFTLQQGYSGGPLMCQQDGSWFQAAVLTRDNNSTTKSLLIAAIITRAEQTMVFTKLSNFKDFLTLSLGPFLSPASPGNNTNTTVSSSGATPAHSLFFIWHLFIFSVFLFYLS